MEKLKAGFPQKQVEIKVDKDSVWIYGSKEGLSKIADLCLELMQHPGAGHLHFGSYGLLTDKSLKGAIVIVSDIKNIPN